MKENTGNFSLLGKVIPAARRDILDINSMNLPSSAPVDFLCLE
jgi:hypothetical protein